MKKSSSTVQKKATEKPSKKAKARKPNPEKMKAGALGANAREAILHGARAFVRSRGLDGLTLEQAARSAGLSKAAVLRHFRTRDDLVRGMLEVVVRDEEERIHRHAGDDPGMILRFIVEDTFRNYYEEDPHEEISSALLAAAAQNPGLLEPLEVLGAEVEHQLGHLRDKELAYIIHLALDGIRFGRMLGWGFLPASRHDAVRQRLLQLVESL